MFTFNKTFWLAFFGSALISSQTFALEIKEVPQDEQPTKVTVTKATNNIAPTAQVATKTNVATANKALTQKANTPTPPKAVRFTGYVSDKQQLWTTRGPGKQYRVAIQVQVGEKVSVLDEAKGYYQIFTQDGKTGWISKKSIQTEESNLSKVNTLSIENERIKYRLANFDSETARELKKTTQELESLKAEHQKLLVEHSKQTEEIKHLTSENARLEEESGNKERTNQITWFTYGGIVGGIGIVIGAILVYLPRPRRNNRDYYY